MVTKIISETITRYKHKIKGKLQLPYFTTVHFVIIKEGYWQWGAHRDVLWITKERVEQLWNEFFYQ